MENFKNGHQVSLPAITSQETQEAIPADDSEVGMQTGYQRLQQAICSSEPIGLDTLLKKIIDSNTQSELLDKLKSLTTSKKPRNKRKLNQANPPAKPSYYPPVAEKSSGNNKNETVAENKPVHKRRKTKVDTSTQNKYKLPKQAPKHIKEQTLNSNIKTGYRRSPRMPSTTAKYWESIKAELRNPNKDE